MAINYPTTLDVLTNPTAGNNLDTAGVLHDVQHSDLNDIAEALEAKVGVTGSAVASSLDYRTVKLEAAAGFIYRASFDGQEDVLSANASVFVPIEKAGTITAATIVAKTAGNVRVDVYSYAPAGGALGSATAIGNITLSAAAHARDTTLTGWTKALTAGQVLELRVAASPAPTVNWLTVSLGVGP